jgi:aminoglycoside phosphotransferase family enzyme/predicted kinase
LIELLQVPEAYQHEAEEIELLETHISWVLLAGDYAYKIKKPLNLGFLDFRKLTRRHFYCEEEVRLNKPWAPSIYIDVVPITISGGRATMGGAGMAVEYAVRMRRFDQSKRLDKQLEAGELSVADTRDLAALLAKRHGTAPRTDEAKREHTLRRTVEMIRENFEALEGSIDEALLKELYDWTTEQLEELEPEMKQRFDCGYFRECHGDLHLGNLVRLPDGISTFDCIEFNEDLRNIDIIADIAFLLMDFVSRHRLDLAAHFLNRYLEFTGDYVSARSFNLYYAYRCLVRAKIAVIRSSEREDPDDARADLDEAHRYCRMAQRQMAPREPLLVVMSGLSGSGKTWIAARLIAALPAIRVRSDVERKRRFGIDETADTDSDVAQGIYAPEVSGYVYARLGAVAELLLKSGHSVILDAAYLTVAQRNAAREAAERAGAGFVVLHTTAAEDLLRERIAVRQIQHEDASEANFAVLDYQLQQVEEPSEEEQRYTIRCRSHNLNTARLVAKIREVLSLTKANVEEPDAGDLETGDAEAEDPEQ